MRTHSVSSKSRSSEIGGSRVCSEQQPQIRGLAHAKGGRAPSTTCFPQLPPCFPGTAGQGGEAKSDPEGPVHAADFLKKNVERAKGFEPRPQPWQGYISERIWCGRRDSNPHSQRETDFLTTSAFAAASRRSWPGLSLRHGLSAEGAARPVSTPSLNRGLGSGLAWGSSPLAFPDFERFCSTNFPVGTPIGSLLRLPISPRPLCHISAITRFVAR
jgi:hypothetical protein